MSDPAETGSAPPPQAPPPGQVPAWKQAKILRGLYARLAASLVNAGPCVRITSFAIGRGWIDETGPVPLPLPPPFDATTVPGELYRGPTEGSASDTTALVKCVVPAGTVDRPGQATVIGLFDQTGALVAAVSFLPEWLTPDKTYEHFLHLNFPVE